MKSLGKVIAPILVLAVALFATVQLIRARPEAEQADRQQEPPRVQAWTVEYQPLRIDVLARGTVLPKTESVLAAEVAAKVVRTSPTFEDGGFFAAGDILVSLDEREYRLELRQAEAKVQQARLALDREQAEARLAAKTWNDVGQGEAPPPLVLREPQLAEAQAMLEAAQAEVDRARLRLERTRIVAPFRGRVRERMIERGQFVSVGQTVARIQAVDFAEIRLPIADAELRFLDLPDLGTRSQAAGPSVTLNAQFAGREETWQGRIVRADGELEARSRLVQLIARVDDPYGIESAKPVLPVGLFVEAVITGRRFERAALLPRSAIFDDQQVLVITPEGRLEPQTVEILRLEGAVAVLADGLPDGIRVCVSRPEILLDGMSVTAHEVTDEEAAAWFADLPSTLSLLSPSSSEFTDGFTEPILAGPEIAPEPFQETRVRELPEPLGNIRTRLLAVERQPSESGLRFEIRLDREPEFTTFQLDQPARFAIDLQQTIRDAQPEILAGDGRLVGQVRIGQFRGGEAPVTRIVFDLEHRSRPTITRQGRNLSVAFEDTP